MAKNHLHFDGSRFKAINEKYNKWWDGKGTDPIVGSWFVQHNPTVNDPGPEIPLLAKPNIHMTHIPVSKLVDKIEYVYSQYEWYGDCFPFVNQAWWGPGFGAAMLGGRFDNRYGDVWQLPPLNRAPIEKFNFEFDPDNFWFKRLIEFSKCATERFGPHCLVSMPDIGGILDIIHSFFPGDEMFLIMMDQPEEMHRICRQLEKVWDRIFNEFAKACNCKEYGYTNWSGCYSNTPCYTPQVDCSYMIGPHTFKEFGLPTLAYQCKSIGRTLFHMDGVGVLNHLDMILGIKELNAIQWMSGEGKKPHSQWPEVYQRIIDGGKGVQFYFEEGFEALIKMIETTGHPGRYQFIYNTQTDKEYMLKYLKLLKAI